MVVKEWENVLGEMVLFEEAEQGKWTWQCHSLQVTADPAVRYPSQQLARIAAAAMIYAFWVTEEATAVAAQLTAKAEIGTPFAPAKVVESPRRPGSGR